MPPSTTMRSTIEAFLLCCAIERASTEHVCPTVNHGTNTPYGQQVPTELGGTLLVVNQAILQAPTAVDPLVTLRKLLKTFVDIKLASQD